MSPLFRKKGRNLKLSIDKFRLLLYNIMRDT